MRSKKSLDHRIDFVLVYTHLSVIVHIRDKRKEHIGKVLIIVKLSAMLIRFIYSVDAGIALDISNGSGLECVDI
jgi:hypothetical protein